MLLKGVFQKYCIQVKRTIKGKEQIVTTIILICIYIINSARNIALTYNGTVVVTYKYDVIVIPCSCNIAKIKCYFKIYAKHDVKKLYKKLC